MPFCAECGNEITDVAKFCPDCGTRTKGEAEVTKIVKKKITKRNDDSLVSELKKLNELKEQGILDEDEFKSAKRKVIEKQ